MLSEWFGVARWTYNQAVQAVKAGKSTVNLTSLRNLFVNSTSDAVKERPYLTKVPYEIRSDVCRDFKKGFSVAKTRLRKGDIPKFEMKFRSRKDRQQSIYMCARAFSSKNNFFYTTYFGKDEWMKSSEPLPDKVDGDCRLLKTKTGKYFLVMPVKKKVVEQKKEREKIAALDPGVRTFQSVYSPEGSFIEIGPNAISRIFRLCKHYDDLQSRWTKVRAKKRRRMRKAGLRLQEKIRNLVKEMHNTTAKRLCERFETILIPKFDTQKMTKKESRVIGSKTAKAMLTWSHYTFRQRLISKAEEMGTHVEVVNEAYTSKTCGNCGHLHRNLGKSKKFKCPRCNYEVDRDFNGARNILIKKICERR